MPGTKPPADEKCKAPEPGQSSGHWWERVHRAVMAGSGLTQALRAEESTLADLVRARSRWPECDALFSEVDQLLKLQARAAVEALAAEGDLRAIKTLANGTLDRLDGRNNDARTRIDPRVASAMLAAGLAETERLGLRNPETGEPWIKPRPTDWTGPPALAEYRRAAAQPQICASTPSSSASSTPTTIETIRPSPHEQLRGQCRSCGSTDVLVLRAGDHR